MLGTAAYLAPEQALGQAATAASDRYALAVAAYELLVGERPFERRHFAALARQAVEEEPPAASARNPACPAEVDAVLARGMAKRPEERWPTAGELVDASRRGAGDAPRGPRAEARSVGVTPRFAAVAAPRPASTAAGRRVASEGSPPEASRPRRGHRSVGSGSAPVSRTGCALQTAGTAAFLGSIASGSGGRSGTAEIAAAHGPAGAPRPEDARAQAGDARGQGTSLLVQGEYGRRSPFCGGRSATPPPQPDLRLRPVRPRPLTAAGRRSAGGGAGPRAPAADPQPAGHGRRSCAGLEPQAAPGAGRDGAAGTATRSTGADDHARLAMAKARLARPRTPPGRACGQFLLDLERGQHRLGRVTAGVALGSSGYPLERLVHGVHGEHAEAHRHPRLKAPSWIPWAASRQTYS